MQAIGNRLLEARTRRGLDIVDIEAATKIRAKYLRALESEDFELLPGPTFVKTFLRTYAEHLGLDAQLLVEEYRAQYEPRELDVPPFVPAARRRERPRRAPRSPRGPPGPGTAVLVAVAALLVIFAILGLTRGKGGGSQVTRTKTTPRSPARRPRHPRPAPSTTVVLRVVPAGPTYICVDHGAGTTPLVNSVINSPMTFTGRHLRINAGMPSVGLIANHRRVQIPPTNQPIGYDFTPTSVTPIPPPQRPCVG